MVVASPPRRRHRTAPGASPSSTGRAARTAPSYAPSSVDEARGQGVALARRRGRAGARRAAAGSPASRTARPPRTGRRRATRRSPRRPAGRPPPGDVVEEQPPAGRAAMVRALRRVLAGCLARQRRARPDLAVRVGVRGAHRFAPVLEHLDPAVARAELGGLVRPEVDHPPDVVAATSPPASGRGAARSRRPGTSRARPRRGAGRRRSRRVGRVRAQRREVVGEDERRRRSPGSRRRWRACCPGTGSRPGRRSGRPLVGSGSSAPCHGRLGPPGRDEDPLVDQRVVAAMRLAARARASSARPVARARLSRHAARVRAATASRRPRSTTIRVAHRVRAGSPAPRAPGRRR